MKVSIRHGAAPAILVAAAVGMGIVWKLELQGVLAPRAVLWGAAFAWLAVGISLRARAWRVVDTPTSKVAAATVGTCEFGGKAVALVAAYGRASATPCVWYKWKLQEYRRQGKRSRWVTIDSWEERHPFLLEDDSGSIRVDPTYAEFNGFAQRKYKVPGRGRSWRQLEWVLPDRAPVYLLGPVRITDGGATLEVGGEGDDDFVVSDDSETTVARRFSAWAWVSLLCGLVAAVTAPYVVGVTDVYGDANLTVEPRGVAPLVLLAGGLYVFALAGSWLFRAYNRLVIVKNQAEKAWASIEVQLQRRVDLVGNLVAVVRGYVEYERSAQAELAAVRARGSLPDANELRAAEIQDAVGHADAQQLMALAEGYPTLRADAQFARLAEALRDAENRIALARTFYNDAVNVMRDRRGTFPYVLVAAFVKMPSLELFETDARDAVALGL